MPCIWRGCRRQRQPRSITASTSSTRRRCSGTMSVVGAACSCSTMTARSSLTRVWPSSRRPRRRCLRRWRSSRAIPTTPCISSVAATRRDFRWGALVSGLFEVPRLLVACRGVVRSGLGTCRGSGWQRSTGTGSVRRPSTRQWRGTNVTTLQCRRRLLLRTRRVLEVWCRWTRRAR